MKILWVWIPESDVRCNPILKMAYLLFVFFSNTHEFDKQLDLLNEGREDQGALQMGLKDK